MEALEPALAHYRNKRYAAMFEALGHRPVLASPADKHAWAELLKRLEKARETGTVGDVLDLCLDQQLFDGMGKVRSRHESVASPPGSYPSAEDAEKAARRAAEYKALRAVPYKEMMALQEHQAGDTPFATQHGVKGQQFPRVLVVVSKGHGRFQIPEMLANFSRREELESKEREAFVRARNLFYVACSRAQEHLALLFTAKLDPAAMDTLREWVGDSRIISLQFDGDTAIGGE